MKWVVGSSIHGCWLGHYEHEKQALVRRLVAPGMRVLDIGANAGFYTLALSRRVGAAGHVWAFEPYAPNAANLLRHLSLNRIGNVTLIQAAVADQAGLADFRIGANNAMGTLVDNAGNYRVPVLALDALIDGGTIPLPDVVKMDVEGAESRVLEGAARLLERGTASLLIALHGAQQVAACITRLTHADYKVFRLDGGPAAATDGHLDEIYAVPTSKRQVAPPAAPG
jgi:FkbM family methyltransferase